MPKKRKLNSKNPKYWTEDKKEEPIVKERRLLNKNAKHKAYALFLEMPAQ
tara:strand:+ start:726 stop:875 length:150 start_codon:yes stop_codon:yes gene_type:complete